MNNKEDYLLAMERSPIKDVETKVLLKKSLTDKIDDREVCMKGMMQVIIMRDIMFLRQKIYR